MVTNFAFAWMLRVLAYHITGKRRPLLSRWHYFKSAFPTGCSSALDIGLSNASLMYISISLYTMCKSTSIVFLLLFAFAFRIEKPSWLLTAVIVSIGIGIALFTYGGATGFDVLGFFMVMTATVMAGLRYVHVDDASQTGIILSFYFEHLFARARVHGSKHFVHVHCPVNSSDGY